MRLALTILGAASICAIGCGVDEPLALSNSSTGGTAGSGGTGGSVSTASFSVRESVEQLHVTHAEPGTSLELLDPSGQVIDDAKADSLGSVVFRKVPPGDGYVVRSTSPDEKAGPLSVMSIDGSTPDQSFYDEQQLAPGSGYITTRDGTKLAVYVTLPGPVEEGPYPTVVNYSGYEPAKPGGSLGYDEFCGALPALCDAPSDESAMIAALMGYATVGVNMRGTGCSGGAYDFFEPLQLLDGYDVIETVAAQPWVKHGRVGMTGLSYPGITQMFVAKTRPPHLAGITPLSVVGNTFSTLVPGGILNDGFAISWGQNVLDKADPYGQGWELDQVNAGDTVCEENQLLHGQKVDIIAKALENPYYSTDVGDPVNPSVFVDEIDVPVFFSGSWQDEQTGPFFFPLMSKFTSAPLARFTAYNGVHPDGFAPQVLVEWKNFLDFHVAREIPKIPTAIRTIGPMLFQEVFGAAVDIPPDRFASYTSFDEALAAYQAEPSVRIIFESGAGDETLGAPVGTFDVPLEAFPAPSAEPMRLYLLPDGTLGDAAPATAGGSATFQHDPEAGQRGILEPGAALWDPIPAYAWNAPAPGMAAVFESAPLAADLVLVGSASADLWISSSVDEADLEVNLSEVRSDGQEMFVQSGWLRASQRKLAPDATELWPSHTHLEADVQPLVAGEWTEVRVGIAAFGHVFRKGSRLRIAIDTPGDSRAEWRFRLTTYPGDAFHTVGLSAEHPSSVVFSKLPGVTVSTPLPPCPSLRGQQCRTWAAYANTVP